MSNYMEMSNGEAVAIFKDIKADKYAPEQKDKALCKVLAMATDNGITKADYRQALHYLWCERNAVKRRAILGQESEADEWYL